MRGRGVPGQHDECRRGREPTGERGEHQRSRALIFFFPLFQDEQMLQQETTIVNKLGLHARASAKLTQLAGNYQSEIWMTRNGRRINAKSIMGVMMLAAGIGSTVTIETEGPDEQDAMDALMKLIADKFGEGQ
jgi:phosphocarrier protein